MKVAVRADASLRIGTGHVARCLALADHLRAEGASVVFVCRLLEGHLCDDLEARGFEVHRLPSPATPTEACGDDDYPKWLGVALEIDAAETSACLEGQRFDWLIVDHYSITASWHRSLRPRSAHILVIDDLAEAEQDCDLLVNQSIVDAAHDLYSRKTPAGCVTLVGPSYALLRPAFADVHDTPPTRSFPARRMLVCFGGVDSADLTSRTLQALASETPSRWLLEVVLGAANPHVARLRGAYGAWPGVEIAQGVSDLARRMARADLAIGAGGISAWERCSAGLPSLVISLAPNQVDICEGLARAGAARYLGKAEDVDSASILRAVNELSERPEILADMSRAALALVDGRGMERVVREMHRIGGGEAVQ